MGHEPRRPSSLLSQRSGTCHELHGPVRGRRPQLSGPRRPTAAACRGEGRGPDAEFMPKRQLPHLHVPLAKRRGQLSHRLARLVAGGVGPGLDPALHRVSAIGPGPALAARPRGYTICAGLAIVESIVAGGPGVAHGSSPVAMRPIQSGSSPALIALPRARSSGGIVGGIVKFLICLVFAAAAISARAAPVFEDSMAQRTLACTDCHGRQGRAGPDGYYPRIAGKPAGYLLNQLLSFRDGPRRYGLMARLLDPLADAYLLEVAPSRPRSERSTRAIRIPSACRLLRTCSAIRTSPLSSAMSGNPGPTARRR
jgi:cytochrome c553